MTAPIDLLLSIAIAASVVLATRTQLRLSPQPWYATRYFAAVASFEAMVVLPAAGYRYGFHTDWSFLYLFEASRHASAVTVGGLVAVAGAAVGTFWLGDFLCRTGRVWALVLLLGGAIVGVGVVAALGLPRMALVGSHAQWVGTFGLRPLTSTDLLFALLIMGACVLLGWVFILYLFAREAAALARASR